MNLTQAFKIAVKSIAAKKARSALTMLGVIIGLAAVIILVSYAEGQNRQMREYYESLGNNVVNINAYSPSGRDLTKTCLLYTSLLASLLSMSHFGREYVLVGPEGFFHRKRRNAHVRTRRPFAPQRGRRSPPAPVRLYPVGAGLVPARGRP